MAEPATASYDGFECSFYAWQNEASMIDNKEIEMKLADATDAAKAKWNASADEFNQWSELGLDEKTELIIAEDGSLQDALININDDPKRCNHD